MLIFVDNRHIVTDLPSKYEFIGQETLDSIHTHYNDERLDKNTIGIECEPVG